MGLTKQYLRYAPTNVFGVVSATRANIKVLRSRVPAEAGKYVACGACEFVFIWDMKKGEIVMKLASEKASEVTSIEQDAHNPDNLAVGYLDGSLRLFNLRQRPSYLYDKAGMQLRLENETVSSFLTFFGHKTSLTCLDFDANGVRLASGSKDTDIVVWDLVGECGLFRLKGHKSPVTSVLFLKKRNILISSSKDMLVKFWDLDTKHCFKTIVLHRSEITDMLVVNDDSRLLTGCQDNEIRVFELTYKDEEDEENKKKQVEPNMKKIKSGSDDKELDEIFDDLNIQSPTSSLLVECNLIGSVVRESKDSLAQLTLDNTNSLFSSHSANEKHVEVYKINTAEEIKKRLAKKLKKTKRKLNGETGENGTTEGDEAGTMVSIEQTVSDEFARVCMIKSKHKIKYVDMYSVIKKSENGQKDRMECRVACLLQNNQIEVYLLDAELLSGQQAGQEAQLVLTLDQAGHRTDVRTLAFNSDSSLFLSASGDSLKVWNRQSLSCIKTFKSDYAVCSLFLSDDNHILIGTKSGKIQLFNISMGRMLENVLAHDDDTCVWSMCMMPDKSGFVSGGADKNVRFWAFELVDDEESKKKRLTFVSTRTLKFDDDVLCVKISPNNRLIAVSLLDSTVKVFFMDSLKLFLNMYGHKQPVLSMDISFDNKLIVTGSADRHIKIWGMDFGDCHRSIFAHEDSIMGVQFVGKTHYVFSVGKDGKLNEWDADKFERIITLDGHLNEIWALCVSHDGKYVLTSSHDKSIRIWEKTNEPLVLEDERETEKEKQYEEEIVKEEQSVSGVTNSETGLATIKTIETIKSAERMIESLQIYLEEKSKHEAYVLARDNAQPSEKDKIQQDPKHPMLLALNLEADDHVLETLKKTKSSEIETMLTILEFEHVKILLELLCSFLDQKKEVELCVRCIMFLLKINIGQITLTETFLPTIELLKDTCINQVSSIQNVINFNLAAAQFYRHKLDEMNEVYSFPTLGTGGGGGGSKKSKKSVYLFKLNSASKN